jgi:hypothetical protein
LTILFNLNPAIRKDADWLDGFAVATKRPWQQKACAEDQKTTAHAARKLAAGWLTLTLYAQAGIEHCRNEITIYAP